MTNGHSKKWKILGQDLDLLVAVWANVVSWLVSTLAPSMLPKLLPKCDDEMEEDGTLSPEGLTRCISIGRPGGMEQLRLIRLKPGVSTIGYNLPEFGPAPFSPATTTTIPSDCIVIDNEAFSINYADCTIRWGLYESAKEYVGWPIVPGFDIAGTVKTVGSSKAAGYDYKPGDRVFGCTLFGAYSSRVVVPKIQLRRIPDGLTMAQAASLPAVSLTALYALSLAGHFPVANKHINKAILIHSAAGGVGSMLVQMSKILGLSPIVGVVGSTAKVEEAKSLGCDAVIDKSKDELWEVAAVASPNGYATIMDANGVSTLSESYAHLTQTGRLIVFGFHSNLPVGRAMLSPLQWIRMAYKMIHMPKFDPMDLTVSNKAVMGFNLSFFAEEKEVVTELFDQICKWLEEGKLSCPRVVEMDMDMITQAHELIQSGKSVGKIVINTK